jgi:hypothetical protein
MTEQELRQLAPNADLGGPATENEIARAEEELVFPFPQQYRDFLLSHDGLCGFIGPQFVLLKSVSVLAEYNRDYHFPEFCPEAVAIGSDGGGEAIVFIRKSGHIAFITFIGLAIEEAAIVAPTFDEFLRHPRPPGWA